MLLLVVGGENYYGSTYEVEGISLNPNNSVPDRFKKLKELPTEMVWGGGV
jgi:hypothetical protein